MGENTMTDRDACIALNMISGIAFKRYNALHKHFDSIGEAAGKTAFQYRQVNLINSVVAEKLASSNWQELCDREKDLAERSGVEIITHLDQNYPKTLNDLDDPPLCLYVRGRLPEFPCRSLAVVGSRKMSRYGEKMTRAITADAVYAGYTIISGLAYGVDTIAHRTTVECGGVTVAVLGGGLLDVQPQENIPLAQDIISRGGAVISEFPLECRVSRLTFPRRNRIIAGLARGTCVVEAGLKSGALISAKATADLGRDVFAVPGQATNEQAKGCHQLIRDGAILTESFDDIARVLDGGLQLNLFDGREQDVSMSESSAGDLSPELEQLLANISTSGSSIEELTAASDMDPAQLIANLMQLEFRFLVERGPDMLYYRRK